MEITGYRGTHKLRLKVPPISGQCVFGKSFRTCRGHLSLLKMSEKCAKVYYYENSYKKMEVFGISGLFSFSRFHRYL